MRNYKSILESIEADRAEFPQSAKARRKIVLTQQRTDRARKVLKAHGVEFKELKLDAALDVHKCLTFRPYSGMWVNRITGATGEGLASLLIEVGAMK